jgi:hypothetical protein
MEMPLRAEESIRAALSAHPGIDQHWLTIEGKGVLGRARVGDLLKRDKAAALAEARQIEHPWYRCQAIAEVAQYDLQGPQAVPLLVEALDAAYSQDEPNRVACVACQPLGYLVQIHQEMAADHTDRLLKIIATEPHGLRRLDGLCAIVIAVRSASQLRQLALRAFESTAKSSRGWRTERIMNSVIQTIAEVDRDAAMKILLDRPNTRYTKASRTLLLANPGASDA